MPDQHTNEELLAKLQEYLPLFGEPILQITGSVFGQFTEEEFERDKAAIVGAAVAALLKTASHTAIGAVVRWDERVNLPIMQDLIHGLAADLQNTTTTRVKQVRSALEAFYRTIEQEGAGHGG